MREKERIEADLNTPFPRTTSVYSTHDSGNCKNEMNRMASTDIGHHEEWWCARNFHNFVMVKSCSGNFALKSRNPICFDVDVVVVFFVFVRH